MMIGFILAAITAIALAVLLVPLLRHPAASMSRTQQARAIYRDQLSEIRRDAERGLLTPEEAKITEIEIQRKILSAAESPERQPVAGRSTRLVAAAIVGAVVPIGAAAVYLAIGSPGQPDQPHVAAPSGGTSLAEHGEVDMEAITARLAERLEREPNDLQGWTLLARSYAAAGSHAKAVEAYRQAFRLGGDDPEIAGGFAEALVAAAGGLVTPEALALFEQLAQEQPKEPRNQFYLGLARAQAGDGAKALEIWLALEADSAPDAPWLPTLREQITAVAEQFKIDVASIAPNRPAAAATPSDVAVPHDMANMAPDDQMAAVQNMAPDDQSAMIRSMVEGLAARLETEPNNLDGWVRLGRSYTVLGEPERAREAYARAVALDPGNAELVSNYADAILAAPADAVALPAGSVDVMRQQLQQDAANPQALWYVGLAEAQARNGKAAAELWNRLLGQVAPGTPVHETVKAKIESLPTAE